MQKGQHSRIFEQFYLTLSHGFDLTQTSKFQKVSALTRGCIARYRKKLYQSYKAYTEDLQAIIDYDPESANVIFKTYPEIKFSFDAQDPNRYFIKVQCTRCSVHTAQFKFCPKCQDAHYCSEVCEFNSKLTHQRQDCRIRAYPKVYHPILIEVHFGADLGHNIEVYYQHEGRASGMIRGKSALKGLCQYLTNALKISSQAYHSFNRKAKMEEKLQKYRVEIKNDRYLQCAYKAQSDFSTGVLKVQVQNLEGLKRLYEQNEVLEQIELYFLGEGALMTNVSEQIHNNHAHWAYIFRLP